MDSDGFAKSRPFIGIGGRLIFIHVFKYYFFGLLPSMRRFVHHTRRSSLRSILMRGGQARLRFNIPLERSAR